MQLTFDTRGYLQSEKPIEISLLEIEQIFVSDFPLDTPRRYLLNELKRYLHDFSKVISEDFSCWIDGSFISKKWYPRDIDIVILLNYSDFEIKEEEIINGFIQPFMNLNYKGIDAYLLKKYPENHNKYSYFKSDFAYWYHLFSNTKPNRNNKTFPKSFIKLIK